MWESARLREAFRSVERSHSCAFAPTVQPGRDAGNESVETDRARLPPSEKIRIMPRTNWHRATRAGRDETCSREPRDGSWVGFAVRIGEEAYGCPAATSNSLRPTTKASSRAESDRRDSRGCCRVWNPTAIPASASAAISALPQALYLCGVNISSIRPCSDGSFSHTGATCSGSSVSTPKPARNRSDSLSRDHLVQSLEPQRGELVKRASGKKECGGDAEVLQNR